MNIWTKQARTTWYSTTNSHLISAVPEKFALQKADLLFSHFRRVKIFSKFSFDWLTDSLKQNTFKDFKKFHFFSSKDAFSEETLFETFTSVFQNFGSQKDSFFKIVFPQVEIFVTRDKKAVDELISINSVEQNNHSVYSNFHNFRHFIVIKAKNPNNAFINRLREKKVKLIEFEKVSKLDEYTKEFYYVSFGKKIRLILQYLMDFIFINNVFFEFYSNFEFDNCVLKKVNFEFKKFIKGAVNVTEKLTLSDTLVKIGSKEREKYKVTQNAKLKKEIFLKQIDSGTEHCSGLFFGSDIFGKNLVSLLKFIVANNNDYKIILE